MFADPEQFAGIVVTALNPDGHEPKDLPLYELVRQAAECAMVGKAILGEVPLAPAVRTAYFATLAIRPHVDADASDCIRVDIIANYSATAS